MKDTNNFDDHLLGAFIDGEVDSGNLAAIIQAMETDTELRERIYRLRRSRDLMQLGFGDATAPSGQKKQHRRWLPFSTGLAASVALLAISFGAGMLSHLYLQGQPAIAGQLHASSSQLQSNKDNVILHISESDPQQFTAAITYAEKFLQEHQSQGYQIDVVAHASGLDIMREDVSPLKLQMVEMLAKYDNVHFIGCANAIKMLRKKGIEPAIIQGVRTDSTAFDHIVNRLQGGGWKYNKVKSLAEI